jgi:hypothetical protein
VGRAERDHSTPTAADVKPNYAISSISHVRYDNRNDPGNKLIETFQAFSGNDGATWTNFNISTAPWNPDKGFFSGAASLVTTMGLRLLMQ